MANFESGFPMNRLYYDLILEVIDELGPRDVPELMKVDKRLRCLLLQRPTRIFGKKIHSIYIHTQQYWDEEGGGRKVYYDLVSITKFPESTSLRFDLLSQNVLLLSQVKRCSVLTISQVECNHIDERGLLGLKNCLANLRQIDKLDVTINDGNNFNDWLEDFKAEVTDRASFEIFHWSQEVEQQLLLLLIGERLRNCKMISLSVSGLYPTAYSALSKTQHELFMLHVWSENVESTIELILNSGIPSGNKEAACFVQWLEPVESSNQIKNLLEIRLVNEPNKTFIMDTMMETLTKHRAKTSVPLGDSTLCYWKRIDENHDCIYVLGDYFLFAKYI